MTWLTHSGTIWILSRSGCANLSLFRVRLTTMHGSTVTMETSQLQTSLSVLPSASTRWSLLLSSGIHWEPPDLSKAAETVINEPGEVLGSGSLYVRGRQPKMLILEPFWTKKTKNKSVSSCKKWKTLESLKNVWPPTEPILKQKVYPPPIHFIHTFLKRVQGATRWR